MSYADRARKKAEELGIGVPASPDPEPAPDTGTIWDDDLIPDVSGAKSAEQYQMDQVLGDLDIIEAYNLWCGKMVADAKGKRESIMVRCPVPGHEDRTPSAAINLDKGEGGVGNCYRCDMGWDKYDLAAWHFGYPVPGYKTKEHFPKLRKEMAEALGFQVVASGKEVWLERMPESPSPAPTPSETPTPTTSPESSTPTTSSGTESHSLPDSSESVTVNVDEFDLSEFKDPEFRDLTAPSLNWREVPGIREGTFLYAWMNEMSHSYEPEEFYLFEGLMALAAATGNNVIFENGSVRPNLLLCIVGNTGSGKSISMRHLTMLLREALPFDHRTGTGVRILPSSGSGEALLDQFISSYEDETTGEKIEHVINGLAIEDEMATFAKRAMRHGSTLREVTMALYDSRGRIEHTSRGHGTTTVKDHYFQLLTSTQPGSIRKLTSDADAVAGFLNRMGFIFGTWKRRPAVVFDYPSVMPAVEPLRRVRAWASGERHVHWERGGAAHARYEAFFLEQIEPLLVQDDSTLEARLGLFSKKLMLGLAINDQSTIILPEHVDAVISMWDYLLQCMYHVGANVGRSDHDELAERLLGYFSKKGSDYEMTFRQIMKQTSAKRFGFELSRRVVDGLVAMGMLQTVSTSHSTKYRLTDSGRDMALKR